eukprot:gene24946-596_t
MCVEWRSLKPSPFPCLLGSNIQGTLTYAQTDQRNSRSVQLFVNLEDNQQLDRQGHGFAPFGHITQGLGTFRRIRNPTPALGGAVAPTSMGAA